MDREPSYFEKLKFERELLNRRITWLLTSQSILFSAYGLAVKNIEGYKKFVNVLGQNTLLGFSECS